MNTDDPFRALADRLNYPNSSTLPALMAMLVTPEEAEWLLALPATPPGLAARVGRPESDIVGALHDLYMRGLIFMAVRGFVGQTSGRCSRPTAL